MQSVARCREGLKDFYGGFATVEDTNETIGTAVIAKTDISSIPTQQ